MIRRPLNRRRPTFFLVQTNGSALCFDIGIDVLLKLFEACERGAAQRLPLSDRKPHLDLIEPGRAGGREMKVHVGMCLKPFLVLRMGAEVVENDVKLSVRKCCGHAIHEVEKLDPATSFRMRRKNLPGGDFQRCEQRGRAVPFVVVALPGQGSAVG